MKKFLLFPALVVLFSLFGQGSGYSILITGFSNSEFTVDTIISDFPTINQTSTTTTGIGTDTNILAGTFATVDITGLSTIQLTASVTGTNPNSAFNVLLFNTGFSQIRTYLGTTTGLSSSPTTITLTFQSQTGVFNDIAGFQFSGQGAGSPLNITFDSIQAIPEPSTWALLAGGLTVVMILRRRRQI